MIDTMDQGHRDNRLLASLPLSTLAFLSRDLKQVSLTQGHVIFEPGAPLDTVYFPQSGLVSLVIVMRDGGNIEAATIGREGAIGLHGGLGKRRSFTRAVMQIGGTVSTIDAARLEQTVNAHTPVRDLILRYTEILWAEAQQNAACNAVHDVKSRLCRWLLQCSNRTGDDEIPLTQEYLAQMLGVRRTTISLMAHSMQSEGLIRYRRGHIVIVSRSGLEASACECYRLVHHERLPLAIGVKL